MIKRVMTALLLLVTCSLYAESGLQQYHFRLITERDAQSSGEIDIFEDPSARAALASYERQNRANENYGVVSGYRIGIYFNNGANARSEAQKVIKECENVMPDIPSTLLYDNPYFKVIVGYCSNIEEAVILLNRAQQHFPKAYLIRESIETKNFVEAYKQEQDAKTIIIDSDSLKVKRDSLSVAIN